MGMSVDCSLPCNCFRQAFLADWYRRQMYASQQLAALAHLKEMREATARIQAQRELAAAHAQAAQRALAIARERAASEAKSEVRVRT